MRCTLQFILVLGSLLLLLGCEALEYLPVPREPNPVSAVNSCGKRIPFAHFAADGKTVPIGSTVMLRIQVRNLGIPAYTIRAADEGMFQQRILLSMFRQGDPTHTSEKVYNFEIVSSEAGETQMLLQVRAVRAGKTFFYAEVDGQATELMPPNCTPVSYGHTILLDGVTLEATER